MLRYKRLSRDVRYPEDCKRIAKILIEHGYLVSLTEVEDMWDQYSDTMAAGWMMLEIYSDEDIARILIDEGED